MRILTFIGLVFVLLFGVSFAVLNAEMVKVNYYIGSYSLHLSLLIVLVLGLGFILGMLVGSWKWLRVKSENSRLRNRIKLVEKEVENLRAIPLKNEH